RTDMSEEIQMTRSFAGLDRRLIALIGAVVLVMCWSSLGGRAAAAGPELSVDLGHTPQTMQRNDEYLVYGVQVKNTADPTPGVGDELFCNGARPQKPWIPDAAPITFTYQWLRNGVPIAGATNLTYTLSPADAERAIQCETKGTLEATNPSESMSA